MNKSRCNAYITLEASFIVPLMTIIFVIIIYITFFEYNSCVIYQDSYIAALRGSQLREMSESEIESQTIIYAKELLGNQLYQYQISPKVEVNLLSVSVGANNETDMHIPSIISIPTKLKSSRNASSSRLNPIVIIRSKY